MSSLERLYITQEETDTRLVLHAIMLSRDHPRIIIWCDDTDVLVVLVYYWSRGALADEVYMHAGHSGKFVSKEQFIHVHHISTKLDNAECKSFLAVHAVSRCDTTSLGKRTAYSPLIKNTEVLQGLESFQDVHTFLDTARRFVLLMHGKKIKKSQFTE